jgi:putative YhbY family RNA-binding protein
MANVLNVAPELTAGERRALRARAHHLRPVVMIGDAGLTAEVLREIDTNLKSHELIKIRVLGDERNVRRELVGQICEATGAQPVQHIGKIVVVYRARPPDEQPRRKRRGIRKPARKTKRSYQNA